MSLFYITVPTREYEVSLREKELDVQDVRLEDRPGLAVKSTSHRDSNASKISRVSDGSIPPDIYIGKAGGKEAEILVSDDFMEVKEVSSDMGKTASKTEDESIEAEISKYFLEKHLEDTLDKYDLNTSAIWNVSYGGKMSQICFTVPAAFTDIVLRRLHSVGVGVKYGSSIAVCSANVYYGPKKQFEDKTTNIQFENMKDEASIDGVAASVTNTIVPEENKTISGWSEFVKSIKSRLTVAQVVSQVQANAVITFDFLMLVFVAGTIACLGLLENNSVILVASMLISPLMGPIMALTFGAMIRDCSLVKVGIGSELVGLFICLLVGFIFGVCLASEASPGPWHDVTKWPTFEMVGRGQTHSIIVGVLMAIPSGIGVALSILAGNAGSLVGVAIAASLLPPAVNCGLFWGLAMTLWFRDVSRTGHWVNKCSEFAKGTNESHNTLYVRDYKHQICNNTIWEFFTLGSTSFGLTMVNISIIFVVAIFILKIKEVAPYTTRNSLRRFWKEDLAHTRKYNKSHRDHDITNIIKDIDNAENPDEVRKRLEQDTVMKQVNRKIGGVEGATIINEYQQKVNEANVIGSAITLPRIKTKNAKSQIATQEEKPKGNWFTNLFARV